MTKKAQIIELLATGKSSFQIAEIIGCHHGYVRAVKRRQRMPETHKAENRKTSANHYARHRQRRIAWQAAYRVRKASQEAST